MRTHLELEISSPVTGTEPIPGDVPHSNVQVLLKRNLVSTRKASPFLLISHVLLKDCHFPGELEGRKEMIAGGVSFYHCLT